MNGLSRERDRVSHAVSCDDNESSDASLSESDMAPSSSCEGGDGLAARTLPGSVIERAAERDEPAPATDGDDDMGVGAGAVGSIGERIASRKRRCKRKFSCRVVAKSEEEGVYVCVLLYGLFVSLCVCGPAFIVILYLAMATKMSNESCVNLSQGFARKRIFLDDF